MKRRGSTAGALTTAIACALAALVAPLPAAANTSDWADTADPFILHDAGRYYAYSTDAEVRNCHNGVPVPKRMFVPFRTTTHLHDWGTLQRPACFSDALAHGPGAWATRSTFLVWAPTVYRNPDNGRFVMLYTAKRAGTDQRCIGRAVAATPRGIFEPDPNPVICPAPPNWALDPNAIVFPDTHNVYLQWRQDRSATESRLYGARYSRDGTTRLTTARLLLSDTAITWDGDHEIENPAIDPEDGIRFLYYSGNFWNSNDYATGVASCGSLLGSGGQCTTLYPNSKPWLGWGSRNGGTVLHTPDNLPGTGGMSFVSESAGGLKRNPAGDPYVAMHFLLAPGLRPMAVYKLVYTPVGPVPIDF